MSSPNGPRSLAETLKSGALALALLCLSSTATAALNVDVEITPTNPEPGERIFVRLTVTNDGGGTESNVSVEFPFPAELSSTSDGFFSDGGDCTSVVGSAAFCENPEVAFWNLGDLAAGTGITVYAAPAVDLLTADGAMVTFDVDALINGVINDSTTAEATVQASRRFDLAISADAEPVSPDDIVSFELTFGNRTGEATSNTELRFPLPTGTTFVAADQGGSLDNGDVVWDLGLLNPGVSGRRQVSISVDSSSYSVGDIVSVDAVQIAGDVNFVNETASQTATLRVENLPDLALALDTDATPLRQNLFSPTLLTVTNRTGSAMFGVRVELYIPPGVLDITDLLLSDGGDCTSVVGSASSCASGELGFWDIGTLGPGMGKTVSIVPTPRSELADGEIIPLFARATSDNTTVRWEKRAFHLEENRTFNLEVGVDQEPVEPGDVLSYELTFGNSSGTATSNSELRFPLPPGTIFVSADGGGSEDNGDVVWDLGLINPGEGGRRRVSITVEGSSFASGDIVTVDAVQVSGTSNFVTQLSRQNVSTRVEALPDLALEIDTQAAPTKPGLRAPVHLTVTNRTGAVMSGVRADLFLPRGLSDITDLLLSDGGDCNSVFGSASSCASGETATWNIGTLGPRTGKTVTIFPTPAPGLTDADIVPFVARATSDSTSDRWERRAYLIEPDRSLELEVQVNQEPVVPDEILTYELTFGNSSGTATTNTELRFPLPSGTTFVSADGGGALQGGAIVWDLGILNPGIGGRRSVSITVDGTSYAAGDIVQVDAAQISGDSNFSTQETRQVVTTRVEAASNLAFEFSTGASPARQEGTSPLHLTVTNPTGAVLSGVQVEVWLPNGLLNINDLALSDGGDCTSIFGSAGSCASGELAFWDIGSLPPGAGKTVSIAVVPEAAGVDGEILSFIARAYSDSSTDQWERRAQYLESQRALELQVDAEQELVAPADILAYELSFANQSSDVATDSELRFPLPTGTSFVSASGTHSLDGNDVVWSIGRLEAGESGMRTVTVQLDNLPGGGEIVLADAVSLDSTQTLSIQAQRATRVKADGSAQIALELDPVFNLPGESFLSELTVDNTTGVQLADVTLELIFPDFLADLPDTEISDGGDCNSVIGSASSCASGESVIWNLGALDANSSAIVSIPPTVRSGFGEPPIGTLVNFYARVRTPSADGAFESRTLIIGNPEIPDVPEMDVEGNDQIISNGDDTPTTVDGTDFGTSSLDGGFVDQTFVVVNAGSAPLLLNGNPIVDISGAGSESFTVLQQPLGRVEAGEESEFVIRFEPCAAGNQSALVTIANNDDDESPYTFTILGEGEVNPDLIFEDDFELGCGSGPLPGR